MVTALPRFANSEKRPCGKSQGLHADIAAAGISNL
jgi:hypothetical protein